MKLIVNAQQYCASKHFIERKLADSVIEDEKLLNFNIFACIAFNTFELSHLPEFKTPLKDTLCIVKVLHKKKKKKKREPPHDNTNKLACAPSEDSDQPGHPPSLIRVFTERSMGS